MRHPLPPLLLGLLVLGGCTVTTSGRATVRTTASASVVTTPTYVTIAKDPPPPRAAVAVRPAQPRAGAVWVEGYWAWNSDWVWVDGHWDSPPQTGFVWEPPVVVAVDAGGYQYHRGYWRRRNNEPPAVYRTAGTIRVHVRAQNDPVPVSRVVVRRGSPPPRQVVVRGGAARGNSSRVVVRQAPAQGRTNVRVRTQGNARTEVRGNGRTDVRVRTREPHLFHVHVWLGLPDSRLEIDAVLVYGQGVSRHTDIRTDLGVVKLVAIVEEPEKPIWDAHRTHGVPDANERDLA